jgi:RNA polymerase sigma-70 factor (ECF subfamily)
MYVNQKEQSWTAAFRRGDEHALRLVFDLYYHPLCHFAKKLVPDAHAAEDIVSEVFVKLWDLREKFEGEEDMRAFLFVAVKNACINYQVKMRRETARRTAWQYGLPGMEEQAEHEMARAMALQRVYAGIEQLPPQRKIICKLIFIQGFSTTEVAKRLGLSIQTVRNQKNRAVRQLRSFVLHNIYEFCLDNPFTPSLQVRTPHIY